MYNIKYPTTKEVKKIEFTYTREDFLTPAPYEEVTKISDPFQREIFKKTLAEYANNAVNFKGFTKQLQAYTQSIKQQSNGFMSENPTQFAEQLIELNAGDWRADEFGVTRFNGNFEEIACTHPIMPVEKYKNINTGELKVKLVFRRGSKSRKEWHEIIVGMDTITDPKKIISLANIGVSVAAGKSAQCLVDYLKDMLDLNYDVIPQKYATTKMGWNEEGFSPYVNDIIFDGDKNFGRIYGTIKEHGDYKVWLEEVKAIRAESVQAKIVLASSFASVLLEPLGLLPFFVHLWGSDSGTGKTVALMVAGSVWANPDLGKYIQTFRSTSVGVEFIAGLLNNMPAIIDELQLAKDNRGKIIFNVYELAAGVGKLRGTKTLGIADTLSWSNSFITSGETPIVSDSDGAGALNRVIEIECKNPNKVISNGLRTSGILKNNYGFAGKIFIENLLKLGNTALTEQYESISEEMLKVDTDDKQALSASVILLADRLATEWIFKDENGLKFDEVAEVLKSKSRSSVGDRAYDFIYDWFLENYNKFRSVDIGDIYGILEAPKNGIEYVYIIPNIFKCALTDNGFNPKSVLSQFKSKGYVKTDPGRSDFLKNHKGHRSRFIALKIPDGNVQVDESDYEIIE